MAVILLQLAGPLQSWGAGSRFVRRGTESAPTKSGILGLIAAAQGRRRSDPVEDLVGLRLGVRLDQPGQLVRDFQTAIRRERKRDGSPDLTAMPLSYRFYLGDAIFLAVLEGPTELVEGIEHAIRSPTFPLYLGRRSCPPARPIALGLTTDDLETVIATTPWLASAHEQLRRKTRRVRVATVLDAGPDAVEIDTIRDHPLSFDPNRRLYGWRRVTRGEVELTNPSGFEDAPADLHDPMHLLGG